MKKKTTLGKALVSLLTAIALFKSVSGVKVSRERTTGNKQRECYRRLRQINRGIIPTHLVHRSV